MNSPAVGSRCLKSTLATEVLAANPATELNFARVMSSQMRVADFISSLSFFDMKSEHDGRFSQLTILIGLFEQALAARIAGFDSQSEQAIAAMTVLLQSSGLSSFTEEELRRVIQKKSQDPEIYRPFSMAPYIKSGPQSLENAFLTIRQRFPKLNEIDFPGRSKFDGMSPVGPVPIEFVRLVLQYTRIQSSDRVLEIGYKTPEPLVALSLFTHPQKFIGVDRFSVPENANRILGERRIELLQGSFPKSETIKALKENGPYSVIMALDSLNRSDLPASIDGKTQAKALYDLMADGGTFIGVNDYFKGHSFSQEDAQQAGFTVVRWEARSLVPALNTLLPYTPDPTIGGIVSLVVLRRGVTVIPGQASTLANGTRSN